MKKLIKISVLGAALLVGGGLLFTPLNISAVTPVQSITRASGAATSPAELDSHRRFALGMIETGNDDYEIGGLGEVSRYQIMPSVWRHYSDTRRYQDPGASLAVAQKHWLALYNAFKNQAHREPTDFDMYVLWNTRYGYYASRGFSPARLNSVVRDRAQRFVNLIGRSQG